MNYVIEGLLIIGIIAILWLWISGIRKGVPIPPYKTVYISDLPQRLEPKVIYVSGEDGQEWFVGFLCPCGCEETIQLSILPNTKPRWKLTKHGNGTVSLHPSVWRTKGCRSHFFFKEGYISWCQE